jgi:hypothetical protein
LASSDDAVRLSLSQPSEAEREALQMISPSDVERIAEGWIANFSVDPYVLKHREMEFWHELDKLIFDCPEDALTVFESIAAKDLTNWTLEGIAVGPLRTFLMLYDKKFDESLTKLRRKSPSFEEMYGMAVEGL